MAVIARSQEEAVLNLMLGAGGSLNAVKVGVFTNNISPDKFTVIGDLTQPVDAAFAAQNKVFDPPFLNGSGHYVVAAPSIILTAEDEPSDAFTIYGWFVAKQAAGNLLIASFRIDQPVVITGIGDGIIIQPLIAYGD